MHVPFLSYCRSCLILAKKVGRKLICMRPKTVLQDLTSNITKVESYPIARGGFGDIWKCTLRTKWKSETNVAVKSLRMCSSGKSTEQLSRNILREFKLCASLRHRNIIPVYGYTYGFSPFIAIVTLWAEHGDLETYLTHQGARLSPVRQFQILRDVITGLGYLHDKNVIHGDLTGSNVLILRDGTACLTDFGLSIWGSDLECASITPASGTSSQPGNSRWLAPELLEGSEDNPSTRPSKCSDIYSFGSIMLHVLTNKIPYYYHSEEVAIIRSMYAGERPDRSRYPALPDEYWHFIEKCWSDIPDDRPSVKRATKMIKDELSVLAKT